MPHLGNYEGVLGGDQDLEKLIQHIDSAIEAATKTMLDTHPTMISLSTALVKALCINGQHKEVLIYAERVQPVIFNAQGKSEAWLSVEEDLAISGLYMGLRDCQKTIDMLSSTDAAYAQTMGLSEASPDRQRVQNKLESLRVREGGRYQSSRLAGHRAKASRTTFCNVEENMTSSAKEHRARRQSDGATETQKSQHVLTKFGELGKIVGEGYQKFEAERKSQPRTIVEARDFSNKERCFRGSSDAAEASRSSTSAPFHPNDTEWHGGSPLVESRDSRNLQPRGAKHLRGRSGSTRGSQRLIPVDTRYDRAQPAQLRHRRSSSSDGSWQRSNSGGVEHDFPKAKPRSRSRSRSAGAHGRASSPALRNNNPRGRANSALPRERLTQAAVTRPRSQSRSAGSSTGGDSTKLAIGTRSRSLSRSVGPNPGGKSTQRAVGNGISKMFRRGSFSRGRSLSR